MSSTERVVRTCHVGRKVHMATAALRISRMIRSMPLKGCRRNAKRLKMMVTWQQLGILATPLPAGGTPRAQGVEHPALRVVASEVLRQMMPWAKGICIHHPVSSKGDAAQVWLSPGRTGM